MNVTSGKILFQCESIAQQSKTSFRKKSGRKKVLHAKYIKHFKQYPNFYRNQSLNRRELYQMIRECGKECSSKDLRLRLKQSSKCNPCIDVLQRQCKLKGCLNDRIEAGNHWRIGLLHPQQSVTNPSDFA